MWAPEIHIVNNKYHIYYSAKNKITGWHALGLAISENPLGPYKGKSLSEALIFYQVTNNITTDCSLNYEFST